MRIKVMRRARLLLVLGLLVLGSPVLADDAEDLTRMLHEFLAEADTEAAHQRFWADDLVYTSSSGTRTTKAEIMAGFSESEDQGEGEPGPVYSAEEVQPKMYGTTAVVAFKLVATPLDDSEVLYYFNTGTFLKRGGIWQVVAWQATRIP